MFTISSENLANKGVHQVNMNRDGKELSIQVPHFALFHTAYMQRLLNQTCLNSIKMHTAMFLLLSGIVITWEELEMQILESPTRAILSSITGEEETLDILVVVKFIQLSTRLNKEQEWMNANRKIQKTVARAKGEVGTGYWCVQGRIQVIQKPLGRHKSPLHITTHFLV